MILPTEPTRHLLRILATITVAATLMVSCGSDTTDTSDSQTVEDTGPVDDTTGDDPVDPNELPGSCSVAPQTPEQMAAFVVMPGFGPESLDAVEALLLQPNRPAGIFINADLLPGSPVLLAALQKRFDVLLAVDEEGGLVQRLEDVYGDFDSAETFGANPDGFVEKATERAEQLAAAGFNVDFAPVVDLRSPSSEAVIGSRSFGETSEVVTANAAIMADALRGAGVLPTFKHFPGHGHAGGDSHEGLVTTPPLAELEEDLAPYRVLASGEDSLVMMGHLVVPGLTGDSNPASLDSAAYDLLRNDIGFDGVAITDDLAAMKAITDNFDATDAGVAAVAAGADIVLYTDSIDYEAVVGAVAASIESGSIPAERIDSAVRRIRTALGCGE